MAHPSLLNECGVNLALLLSSFLQLSLEAFSSVISMLRALATVPHSGMHSFWFTLFVSVFGLIFKELIFFFFCLVRLYGFCFCLVPVCPVLTAVPLSIQNWESSCGCTERVYPNPLIERRMKQARVWGCWSVYSPSLPPILGRAESHPRTRLHLIAHLSHITTSCVQSFYKSILWSPNDTTALLVIDHLV